MLAEGILTGFQYEEMKYREKHKQHICQKKEKVKNKETWRDLVDAPARDELGKQNELTVRRSLIGCSKDQQAWRSDDQQLLAKEHMAISSPALQIVRQDRDRENQLDLYTSWSYTSIYKNYPDLHIGGDHIGNLSDSGCDLDHDSEISDGPVLLSVDIPMGHSPFTRPLEKPSIKLLQSDESRDRSFTLQSRPFSNSVLNGYMEKHVEELYKQFFEENLTTCGSLSTLLASGLLLNNAAQISLQISQEQNLDTCRSNEMLLQHLCGVASRDSSEFTTPMLQISNFEIKKYSDSFAKKIFRAKHVP
uniref:Protein CXorf21-like n=1 Tax=Geotrypetes seraphini TaxID=260995 RepID=A0A6P8RFC4_GEOSA|nr:protein CXorf21-like [Geotrypetes seraphini]